MLLTPRFEAFHPPHTPSRLLRALALAGLTLLGSCSLVPGYQQPALPLAPQWSAKDPSATPADAAGGPWWREFHSAELNGLIARGLNDNYSLKAAVSRVDQARAIAQVAGAGQYPNLSLGGNYQRQNNYGSTKKSSVFAEATYEVDFWGKQRATADSSQALANASQFDAQTLRMTLGASIADTYFQVLSLQDRVRLAQSIAADASQVLDLVQVQASQGAVSSLEVEQQRNAQQTFQAAVPLLQQQLDAAQYQLATLVGVPPEGFKVQQTGLDPSRYHNPRSACPSAWCASVRISRPPRPAWCRPTLTSAWPGRRSCPISRWTCWAVSTPWPAGISGASSAT